MAPSDYSSSSSSAAAADAPATEPPVPPPAPSAAPAPPRKKFDPLSDMLGIQTGLPVAPANQVALHHAHTALPRPATLEQTAADRVANVKSLMSAPGVGGGGGGGFGVAQTQMTVHAQQMALQQQQQALYMQHQQALVAYQTMAMYQTGDPRMMQQQLMAQQQQQQALMAGAMYRPTPNGYAAVPAMQAERVQRPAEQYRVQRGREKVRVSDSDTAFGPIIDQLKQAALRK